MIDSILITNADASEYDLTLQIRSLQSPSHVGQGPPLMFTKMQNGPSHRRILSSIGIVGTEVFGSCVVGKSGGGIELRRSLDQQEYGPLQQLWKRCPSSDDLYQAWIACGESGEEGSGKNGASRGASEIGRCGFGPYVFTTSTDF